MLVIDGSQGEGGGQILRTSLTLAMVTGTDIRVENIRAGRSKPGLMRQHLACVKAAQQISNATLSGAAVGSTQITFKPKAIQAGDYHFAVGTAGSTLLIFQTVLPALALAKDESTVLFEGGTHNMFAPSFDFIQLAFAPLLQKMGVTVSMELSRHGFYPQGGGQWRMHIRPCPSLGGIELLQTGELLQKQAVVTSANIPSHVPARELEEIQRQSGWPPEALQSDTVQCRGSGNLVSLRLYYEHCTEVVEYVGKLGVSAEQVAKRAVKALRRFQLSNAAVGEHLADQLLLPMALGQGGCFRTMKPSLHTRTNADVIHTFTGKQAVFEELDKDLWQIRL